MQSLVTWFTANLAGKLSGEAIVFIISMIPILELRGGLLAASPAFLNVPILRAVPICIIGNLIPIPFILFLFSSVLEWMKGVKVFRPFALWLERHILNRREQIEKYEFWGLVLLVAIPLPGTGAWTGAMAAALVDMQLKRAVPAIFVGVVIAGIIVSLATAGVVAAI
jgi:uncharacterized membrane protein